MLYCLTLPSFPWGTAVVLPVMDRVGGHTGTVPTSPLHRQLSCWLITVTPEQAATQHAVHMEPCPQLPQTTAQSHTEIKNSNILAWPNTHK